MEKLIFVSRFEGAVHHGREGVAWGGGWSHDVHSQEAECSASFLLIIQSGSPAYETAPPISLLS